MKPVQEVLTIKPTSLAGSLAASSTLRVVAIPASRIAIA
jgi:hypothetical protein